MAHIIDRIRASVGARIITVAIVGITTAALFLAAITSQFVASITEQAASEATTALRDQGQISLRRLTDEQSQRYDQIFREITNRSEALARQAGRRLGANRRNSLDRVRPGLERTLNNIPEVTAAWVITEKAGIAYAPDRPLPGPDASADSADIRNSVFYQTALSSNAQSGQAQWTPIYQDPAGQGLMISAVTPISGPVGDTLLGVAGINITINSITTRLLTQDPLDIGPDAPENSPPAEVSLLMDADTTPVAVPASHRTLLGLEETSPVAPGQGLQQSPITEVGPSGLSEAIQTAMMAEGTDTRRFMMANRPYIAAFARIDSTEWILANLIAEDALVSGAASARRTIETGIVTTTLKVSLIGAVLVLLVAGALTVYLRATVATPLRDLTRAAERIAGGQYRMQVPVRGQDEIARMSERFNDLSSRLADVMEDLEQRVAERTADAEAARDYFHSIFESSPVGIIFIDGDRRIQQFNSAFQALVDCKASAIAGASPAVFYKNVEEARRVGRNAYPILKSGGTYEAVVTLARSDGTAIITSVMGRAVNPDVLHEGFIWVLQDITEQKRLENEMARLATHDHLTGSYNRLKIVEALEQTAREADRYARPFSVMLFDIDNFKAVNDTHGHTAGDRVLKQLTATVEETLRDTDFLGRWGGEEFLVVAPHTAHEGARTLAERIRMAVAASNFRDIDGITISIGVAEYRPGETLEQLEERADRLLYKAKKTGRNRVVSQ